ncbi:MAG: methyl-accepting chemotaxis protein [Deltaproteobacteria bacterium]|jgi:methyl-accepting chemotaxis protein|nr:methyl-accepting chemotaxis protein [Deltaproteobacteria bacterium]
MDEKPGIIKRSIGLQISLLITAITLITLGTSSLLNSRMENAAMLKQLEHESLRVSGLLRLIIDKPMLVGDDSATSREFDFLARNFADVYISIASFNKSVTYSTFPADVRKPLENALAGRMEKESGNIFRELYNSALGGSSPEGRVISMNGRSQFLHVSPIFNEKSCHHCHGASQNVLGAMAMLLDVQDKFDSSANRTAGNIALSAAGGILLILIIYMFIRRRVTRRLTDMARTSDAIVAGDYDAIFNVSGSDELGYLTRNLSDMLGSLKKFGVCRSVMDGISIPSAMCDIDGKLTFVNNPLLDLLGDGRKPEELTGSSADLLFYGEESYAGSVFKEAIKTKSACLDKEEDITARDGSTLRVCFNAAPVYDLEGTLTGAFCCVTDLTAIRGHESYVMAQNVTINKAAMGAGVLTGEMDENTNALAGQISAMRLQASKQRELADATQAELEELNRTMGAMAENASQAAELAGDVSKSAGEGTTQAERVSESMEAIVVSIATLRNQMEDLGRKTEGIGQIMQVIQDIADQTNLLALNAAIEAARAGDAGRGFAVVADEVRKLAEKTMQSTVQVGNTVKEIRASAATSVKAVGGANAAVCDGSEQVKMTGEILRRIRSLAEEAASNIDAVATAVKQQYSSTEMVSGSVRKIRQISEESDSAASSTETAVRALVEIAERLNGIITGMTKKKRNAEVGR